MPDRQSAPAFTQRQKLEAAASLLFGDRWQCSLARFISVDERLVRRWAAGERPVPSWVWRSLLAGLEVRREDIDLRLPELRRIVEEASAEPQPRQRRSGQSAAGERAEEQEKGA